MTQAKVKPQEIVIKERVPLMAGELEVDLTLKRGEVTLLAGKNGLGKSSLLQFIFSQRRRFFPPGEVLGFAWQGPLAPRGGELFGDLLQLMQEYASAPQGKSQFDWVKRFSAQDLLQQPICTLSGGQQQILKILMAVNLNPHWVFLDEPSQFLDAQKVKVLLKLIQWWQSQQVGVILIEHRADFLSWLYRTNSSSTYVMTKTAQQFSIRAEG